MKKVIVAHPGKQHSYRTAAGLERAGMLSAFVTTTYNIKGSITNLLYVLSKGNIKKKIASHYSVDIPDEKIILQHEILGNGALIVKKLPLFKRLYGGWNNYLNDCFGKSVAKFAIKNKVDIVISYDYNSAKLFEIIKKHAPQIKCVLDVSIATRPFMKKVFSDDIEKTGALELRDNYPEIWDDENLKRVYKEIEYADIFLAPSQVVKESLLFCGVQENRIKIVPYGTDCAKFSYQQRTVHDGPLNLIFVGAVNHRKGIHHLLKVVSNMSSDEVQLTLVGGYDQEGFLYKEYHAKENIHFYGFATHDILASLYHAADVFVLPSLGEGMAMVIMEAMSSGLPVIISSRTGGNDAIDNGVEGFEFEAGDDLQLEERIRWFIDHKDKIPMMSEQARRKAEIYTWDVYENRLAKTISELE